MLYMDFKHMMTRRLSDNSTASVTPGAANTLWYSTRNPLGPPQKYATTTLEVTAMELAGQLQAFNDQHVLYLNAMPQVQKAADKGVQSKCAVAGSCWTGLRGASVDKPILDIAKRYVEECGRPGFGISDDVLLHMTERAKA